MKKLYEQWKTSALREVLEVRGLIRLLMKRRNTATPWTREEKNEIRKHLKALSKTVPFLLVFSLPGGSLLLPVLALALDRRRAHRIASARTLAAGEPSRHDTV